jgi:predicted CXXCH cytochrome family protein
MALWGGCSVERNYRVLSFFFDGVPDPSLNGKKPGSTPGQSADPKASPTYSVHKPYAEDRCAECHSQQFQLTRKDSGVCLKCHQAETSKHERMHGPVAAGACLWCHNPHESAYPHLFQGEARAVCTQCHDKTVLKTSKVPEHGQETVSCLACHFGHGGTNEFMLRTPPPAAEVEPATQERP